MIAWPATLPQYFRRSDFQFEPLRPRVSFEPDEGLPIERRNGSVDMDDLTCAIYLKTQPVDEVQIFRDFVDVDLEGGFQQFSFPRHPLTGQSCVVKIMGDRPYVLQPVSGVEFVATFQLRVISI